MSLVMTKLPDPYASGVLVPERHGRLVQDIKRFAADAAIPPSFIWTSLKDTCDTDVEIDYVRRFQRHAIEMTYGLCYVGQTVDAQERMSAIAGALVRNFIRARVLTVSQVAENSTDLSGESPSCLLIPNFYSGAKASASVPAWKLNALLDVLAARHAVGAQTVLFVSDMDQMASEYGEQFRQQLTKHYIFATGGEK